MRIFIRGPNSMQCALINNARDLHLQHGPIDLIIHAEGSKVVIDKAYSVACRRFETVLPELVTELTALRMPVSDGIRFSGPVARRMRVAAKRFSAAFLTPMIAVAGAVADEVLSEIIASVEGLQSVSVNNGGDIAVWLAPEHSNTVGIADPVNGQIVCRTQIDSYSGIGGIATSGRHGRSISLGIADSVTVMAKDAATADAAATLIANAVDLPASQKVSRQAAIDIDPDSDLGMRMATVDVAKLTTDETMQALKAGLDTARQFKDRGCIVAAWLLLQGRWVATEGNTAPLHNKRINSINTGEYVHA